MSDNLLGSGSGSPERVNNGMNVTEMGHRMAHALSLVQSYRVTDGKAFRMEDFPHDVDRDTLPWDGDEMDDVLQEGVEAMSSMQDMMYAQDKWGLLVIFQAMDAAGKDGAIKHVMSGVNPQGCEVTPFKTPGAEELDHDFLWRCMKRLPERGRIGIFNRSYYEEVLVVRVHDKILQSEKLPGALIHEKIWQERLTDIANFEQYLGNNGIRVIKIFLHLSKKEQKKRFLDRIEHPEKNWKFSQADIEERAFWKDYMTAYKEAIQSTATPSAPWYVLPADDKKFARIMVAAAIVSTLAGMDLSYPVVSDEQRAVLRRIREQLLQED
ncbi:MAG: polyphosphate kinase 2 family protein [Marinilabiliales bacterium]|nr:polyphosphate kinase 2 family protein [Marinilabiliales bacterium]